MSVNATGQAAAAVPGQHIVDLVTVDRAMLVDFDAGCSSLVSFPLILGAWFGARRGPQLDAILANPESINIAAVDSEGIIQGYAAMRVAEKGMIVGPLFACRSDTASLLLSSLLASACVLSASNALRPQIPSGTPVSILVPERPEARDVLAKYGAVLSKPLIFMHIDGVLPPANFNVVYGATFAEFG